MGHSAEHLEHAEHAHHAAFNPLDRKVAMTMAIFAAILAAAAMISHRGHTETLRLSTESNIKHTKSSDQWAFFQAANIRSHEYKAFIPLLEVVQARPGTDELQKKTLRAWRSKIDEYEGQKDKPSAAGTAHGEESEGEQGAGSAKLKGGKLGKIQQTALRLEQEAHELQEASHAVHRSVDWIDFGHLGLELALVLSSITVLTKQRGFWYTGIAAAGIGLALVLVGVSGLLQQGHI
jgi:hypothetical protein